MKRLTAANMGLYRAGRVLWHNIATLWLVVASALLVVAFLDLHNLGTSNRQRISEISQLRKARVAEIRQVEYKLCRNTDRLKVALVSILGRSEKSLRTIAYYRQHPAEARKALANTHAEIKLLLPVPGECSTLAHLSGGKR